MRCGVFLESPAHARFGLLAWQAGFPVSTVRALNQTEKHQITVAELIQHAEQPETGALERFRESESAVNHE
jgi:hypothetical protein